MSNRKIGTKSTFIVDPKDKVTVEVCLYKPFVDFLREYMAFFGAKATLEDVLRDLIYDQVDYLFRELTEFAEQSNHFLEPDDLHAKHPHLTITSTLDEDQEK